MHKKLPLIDRKYLAAIGIPTIFFPGLILASILGWHWQTDLTKLAARGGFYQSKAIFPEHAAVDAVFDGDTILIDNGETVRLIGINAPDRGQDGYQAAKEYLTKAVTDKTVELEYDKYQDDKFGRILAYVWQKCTTELGCHNGRRMLNWLLVKEGRARVVIYEDRRKLLYEDYLKSAGI